MRLLLTIVNDTGQAARQWIVIVVVQMIEQIRDGGQRENWAVFGRRLWMLTPI